MAENGPEWARNSRKHSKISIPSPKKTFRLCWGCFWSYNISVTTIYQLSDSTHSLWFYMTECWFLSDWLHCFWLILTNFHFLWLIIGSVELVFGLTTFLLLSPTISKWYHPFNLVLCYQMGRTVNLSIFSDIFGPFLVWFLTFCSWVNPKYFLNGQIFY